MRLSLKALSFILLGTAAFSSTYSQEAPRQKPGRVLPTFVQIEDGITSPEAALIVLRRQYKLDARTGFSLLRAERDGLGYTHSRFTQIFDGRPVEGGVLVVHQSPEGVVEHVNGDVFAITAKAASPAVTESAARDAALQHGKGTRKFMWEGDTASLPAAYAAFKRPPVGELVWAPREGRYGAESPRLCWKFDVYAVEPQQRAFYFVDATTGEVLWVKDRIHEGSANGTANTMFSGVRSIITDSVSPTLFRLWDTTRGNGIRTWDLNTSTWVGNAVDFTDADNYWNNSANLDRAAGDVHWGTQQVYEYFDTAHARQSYDGMGAEMMSYVHYDFQFANAFWDGTAMYYGDGSPFSSITQPLTCIDVVAHELTHGVTEFSANLDYWYESGALNESFSDIFGNTIERVTKPTTASWIVGEEITMGGAGIRSMSNPNVHGDPDTYLGTNWYSGSLDNGGVHTNSGVQNFWFYLLTTGGSGTNDNNAAYSVTGIGLSKAAKIAYRNLTVYLTSTSDYADARAGAIQAAIDLYGGCSAEVIATTNAWHAVGVGAAYSPGGAGTVSFTATPTFSCTLPAPVQFTNTSANAQSSLWTFGDGTTSTANNPLKVYNAPGQYTVKLKVTRCNGSVDSVTYTNYITVDTAAQFCDTTTLTTGTQQSLNACTGVIVDNGGANGMYSDGVNSGVLVTATPGSTVRFKFTQFATESGFDYVTVYNGPTTASPVIGSYTGWGMPNNGNWIYTSGHQFLVRFYSDGSVVDQGFVMPFECLTQPPVADFYSPDTVSCDPSVVFVNTSTPTAGVTWAWTFGDGTTSTLANPTKVYSAPGTYSVQLIACNVFGCDTMLRTAYIHYDTALPACQVTPTPPTGTTTIVKCNGMITDPGGVNGDYTNYLNGGISVSTTAGNQYRLRFTQLKTESCCDFVQIYDGPNASSSLIGTYGGWTLPNGGGWIYTNGPSFYVRFYTDGSVVDSGFKLQYECLNTPLTVNFYSPDSITCDNSVTFVNTTQPAGTSYTWFFGDGTTSTLANPTKIYAAQGTYTVKLKACNGVTCDSITKTAYIVYDTASAFCQNTVTPPSGTTTVTRCTGTISDNGGMNGPYTNNVFGGVSANTTAGNGYRFKFNQMRMADAGDYVTVYNGPTTASPVIGTYTGTTLPNAGGWIYTSGPSFYVRFQSSSSGVDSGFVLQYECLSAPPIANFYSPDTLSCDPSVVFVNTSTLATGATCTWYFGDGTTSTLTNPTKIYSAPGTYTVKLKVCNAFGCDSLSRTAYIVYDTTLPACQITPTPNSGTTTIVKCNGMITDPGGVNGYYGNYHNGAVSVSTAAGNQYRLRFTQLRTESCCDYVQVYNGPNASSPLIGTYQGWTLPNGGNWIYTSGPSFYVRFYTDGSVVDSGFKLQYECLNTPLTANFYSPDSITCDPTVAFVNTTQPSATSYTWTFGDGTTSTLANPIKTYTAQGIYTVKLKACNALTCDSVTKVAYIVYDSASAFCQNTPVSPTGTVYVNRCSGTISDPGGLNGPYSNYQWGGVSVSTNAGTSYRFRFTQMKTADVNDVVTVYNGPNTWSPLIGSYTGTTLPNVGGWIYTSGPSFYVQFSSDYFGTDSGFVLQYECLNAPPVPDFYALDTVTCNGFVAFQNITPTGVGNTYVWDFGDGTTSTLTSPTKVYTTPGTYSVKLKACNVAGCDSLTRTAYIVYNPALPACQVTPVPPSGNTSLVRCNGVIADDGGANAIYSNYVNGGVSVTTTAGTYYRMRFTQFSTESGFDYVTVYNGPNASSPMLGSWSGGSLPNSGNWFYTTSPNFFVHFYTDGSVVSSGFQLEYECLSAGPMVSFYSPDSVSCDNSVAFVNTTTNASTYLWNFGDGTTSTAFNPGVHIYGAPGVYTVSLTACTSGGACSTLTKPAYIQYAPLLPTAIIPDTVNAGTPFTLTNTTAGVSSVQWLIDGMGVGTSQVQTAQIATTGAHTATLVVSAGSCSGTLARSIWVRAASSIGAVTGGLGVKLYPNPAQRFITVACTGLRAGESVRYRVMNGVGQTVTSGDARASAAGTLEHSIALPDLAAGTYSIRLQTADGSETRMFTVQQP